MIGDAFGRAMLELLAPLTACSCEVQLPMLAACLAPTDGALPEGNLRLSVAGEVAESG